MGALTVPEKSARFPDSFRHALGQWWQSLLHSLPSTSPKEVITPPNPYLEEWLQKIIDNRNNEVEIKFSYLRLHRALPPAINLIQQRLQLSFFRSPDQILQLCQEVPRVILLGRNSFFQCTISIEQSEESDRKILTFRYTPLSPGKPETLTPMQQEFIKGFPPKAKKGTPVGGYR